MSSKGQAVSQPTNLVTSEEARALLAEKPKRQKYGNTKVTYNGETFDSIGECERWKDLQLLEKAGEIHDLIRQVHYVIAIPDLTAVPQTICVYVADFTYQTKDGQKVVEDWKPGVRTAVYKLKKRLMKVWLGIQILETGRTRR